MVASRTARPLVSSWDGHAVEKDLCDLTMAQLDAAREHLRNIEALVRSIACPASLSAVILPLTPSSFSLSRPRLLCPCFRNTS